jgi:hypothetical protein
VSLRVYIQNFQCRSINGGDAMAKKAKGKKAKPKKAMGPIVTGKKKGK